MSTTSSASERAVLTVAELSDRLRAVVEEGFPAVWVEGEISNFRVYASGHAYFTLKDEQAQLRCALFRTRARRVKFEPGDGQHVLAFGSVEVYAQRGEYQLVVELLEPRGLGALQLAFEQLKQRLAGEGLFDQARKRPLPRFPRTIGVVTSPDGAALRDILRVIGRRFGDVHIVVAPARVQGDGAAAEVAQGVRDLNALGGVDVIIVGRGGGSLEDLWAFNDEMLARTLAASKVPIVSAVGHEVDYTIADFVADVRAATPSQAAELVVGEKAAIADALADLTCRLTRAAARPLRDLERRADDLTARLRQAMRVALGDARHRVTLAARALRAGSPHVRAAHGRERRAHLDATLARAIARRLDRERHRLVAVSGRLDSLSPLAVLGRGYSLTLSAERRVIRSWREVRAGDGVRVLLGEGSLDCRVDTAREQDDRPAV